MEGDHSGGEDAVNEAFGVGDDGQGLQVFVPEGVPRVGAARVLDEGGGEHRGAKREDAAEKTGAEGQEEQLAEGSGEDGKAGAHEQGSSGETDEVQLETRCGGGFEQGKQGKDGNGAAKEVDGNGLQAW